jgi:hypothetical protein
MAASSLLFVLGVLLQKLSHDEQRCSLSEKRAVEFWGFVISWRWMSGLLVMSILPVPLESVAHSSASSRLLAQMSALPLLLLLPLLSPLLGERSRARDLRAMVLMAVGITATQLHAPERTDYSLEQLRTLWKSTPFLLAESVLLGLLLLSLAALLIPDGLRRICCCCCCCRRGGGGGGSTVREAPPPANRRSIPLLWAGVAGLLAAQFHMVQEGLSSMLRASVQMQDQGVSGYLFMGGALVLFVAQLSALNVGLTKFEASLFLPLFFAARTLCSALFGGLGLHKQYQCLALPQWIVLLGGCAVTAGSMAMLVAARWDGGGITEDEWDGGRWDDAAREKAGVGSSSGSGVPGLKGGGSPPSCGVSPRANAAYDAAAEEEAGGGEPGVCDPLVSKGCSTAAGVPRDGDGGDVDQGYGAAGGDGDKPLHDNPMFKHRPGARAGQDASAGPDADAASAGQAESESEDESKDHDASEVMLA